MSNLFNMARVEAQDSSGGVLAGAKLEFFTTATSTNLDSFSDEALTVVNANPVVADSAGRWAAIFLKDADYKVTLRTTNDVQIWSADPVHGGSSTDLVTATGTTTARSLAKRFAEISLSPEDEGAAGDGVADDGPEINSAIGILNAAGGGVLLLRSPSYATAVTIDLSAMDNIEVRGYGSGGQPNLGGDVGSKILWIGTTSTSNVVMKINGTVKTVRPKLSGFQIDCDEKAGIGLQVYSCESGHFEDLAVKGYTNIGYDLAVNSTEDGANHNMTWTGIHADQVNASATAPIALQLDGSTASVANTNFNSFQVLTLVHRTGLGIILKNCDNNFFWNVRCEGSGDALEFQAAATDSEEARGNTFGGFTSDGAITARAGTVSSNKNFIYYDSENPTPTPTVESGAVLSTLMYHGRLRLEGPNSELLLLGDTFAQLTFEDKSGTTARRAAKIRISDDLLLFQTLADNLAFRATIAEIDLANDEWNFKQDVNSGGNHIADVRGILSVKSFTVSGAPNANTAPAGSMIFVSDETGGATLAFGDGTNWRRCHDLTIIA